MDLNHQKEQFSSAYLGAVAAVAGFTCYKPVPDLDSIDWGLAEVGGNGTTRSPKIELQLKCTETDVAKSDTFPFPISIKNYDDLRDTSYQVPRILVVVIVPDALDSWSSHSESELMLRRCGYWTSLRGMPESPNSTSVTITMRRVQQFSVESLVAMMARVGGGGLP